MRIFFFFYIHCYNRDIPVSWGTGIVSYISILLCQITGNNKEGEGLQLFLFVFMSFSAYPYSLIILPSFYFQISNEYILVVSGATLPLAGVVHSRCADGAGN